MATKKGLAGEINTRVTRKSTGVSRRDLTDSKDELTSSNGTANFTQALPTDKNQLLAALRSIDEETSKVQERKIAAVEEEEYEVADQLRGEIENLVKRKKQIEDKLKSMGVSAEGMAPNGTQVGEVKRPSSGRALKSSGSGSTSTGSIGAQRLSDAKPIIPPKPVGMTVKPPTLKGAVSPPPGEGKKEQGSPIARNGTTGPSSPVTGDRPKRRTVRFGEPPPIFNYPTTPPPPPPVSKEIKDGPQSEFFKQVVNAAKTVLLETKNLKEAAMAGEKETALQHARTTARSTIDLMSLLQKQADLDLPNKDSVKNAYINECGVKVKTFVLEFIEGTKSQLENPYDFMGKQKLDSLSASVVSAIRALIKGAESMTQAGPKDGQLEKHLDTLVSSLQLLSDGVNQRKDVQGACVELAHSMSKIVATATDAAMDEQMRNATLNAITAARSVGTKGDDVALKQWSDSRTKFIAAMKDFLFSSGNSNLVNKIAVEEAPPPGSPVNLIKPDGKPQFTQSEKETAQKIVAILTQRYPNFNNEWKSQPTRKLEESIAVVAAELNTPASSDDPVMKELNRIINMKDKKDWQAISKELKNFTRKLDTHSRQASLRPSLQQNTESNLIECAGGLGEVAIDLIVALHELVTNVHSPDVELKRINTEFNKSVEMLVDHIKLSIHFGKEWLKADQPRAIVESIKRTESSAQLKKGAVAVGKEQTYYSTVEALLEQTAEMVRNTPKRGVIIEGMVTTISEMQTTALGNYFTTKMKIEETLQDIIYRESNAVRIFAVQLMTSLSALAVELNQSDYSILLQLLFICRALELRLKTLLNAYETLYYLLNVQKMNETSHKKLRNSFKLPKTASLWEKENSKEVVVSKSGEFLGATLNHLIRYLTTEQDSKFLSTFLLTYQSFTTPWILLEKLRERYEVPPSLESQETLKIKLRVCVVLQHWIREQFGDFNSQIIEALRNFINQTIKSDGQDAMAERLDNELRTRLKEQTKMKRRTMAIDPLMQLKVPEGGFTVLTLIMQSTENEIARQLTVIEFQIFAKIKPSELLNQAWNKEKIQYKSPNVIEMINRSNSTSFWVASMVLWAETRSDRANAISKFIKVAQHLHQLHNFNTLIAVIAGLNLASISRLKHSWALVEKPLQESLKKLQGLFDPSNSSKIYRNMHKIATSQGPCLPYLAIPLSDLTFTEDGNPDELQNNTEMINFVKRELICNIIRQVQLNQQPAYTFPVVEPLNTFLRGLPFSDEKSLYDISLAREPRGADVSLVP